MLCLWLEDPFSIFEEPLLLRLPTQCVHNSAGRAFREDVFLGPEMVFRWGHQTAQTRDEGSRGSGSGPESVGSRSWVLAAWQGSLGRTVMQ